MKSKIIDLEKLPSIVEALKKEGKKVALCHGCFDLLHLGHIKHFEAAKQIADVVIVTITPDIYVNKGPGRPIFNEMLRMRAIEALENVDYVALNKWKNAIETIQLIKPNFYVKGKDYKNCQDEENRSISLEKKAINDVGGEFIITEEMQFSSSSIINSYFSPLSEPVLSFIKTFKEKYSEEDIIKDIEELRKLKILVIGDVIIDEYHYCNPLGKSTKFPTLSSIYLKEDNYAGGSLAVANHLAQFAGKVELITCLGEKDSKIDFIESKLSPDIKRKFFYRADGPTPVKRRYIDTHLNNKIFEITFVNNSHIDKSLENDIINYLKNAAKDYDLIMVTDFGHGLITPEIIKCLEISGKYLAVNAQTNSNNYGFNHITKYKHASYISIDENELRLPFGDNQGKIDSLIRRLQEITNADTINITRGQKGSVIYKDNIMIETPAFSSNIKDSLGAGDAVLSITSLCAYQNVNIEKIAFIGNCIGAMAIEIIGNEHPVYKKDLIRFIKHFLK